eukprot:6827069-Pyramimonas_sp.AAC.1
MLISIVWFMWFVLTTTRILLRSARARVVTISAGNRYYSSIRSNRLSARYIPRHINVSNVFFLRTLIQPLLCVNPFALEAGDLTSPSSGSVSRAPTCCSASPSPSTARSGAGTGAPAGTTA